MTKEEKQKAIDTLKMSVPIKVLTQEEFNDYIQTLNKIMNWLEQEPCEDCVSRQAVLEVIRKCHCEEWVKADIGASIEALSPVTPAEKTNKWISADVIERIKAEIIENSIEDYIYHGCGSDELIIGTNDVLNILDKYKASSTGEEGSDKE